MNNTIFPKSFDNSEYEKSEYEKIVSSYEAKKPCIDFNNFYNEKKDENEMNVYFVAVVKKTEQNDNYNYGFVNEPEYVIAQTEEQAVLKAVQGLAYDPETIEVKVKLMVTL